MALIFFADQCVPESIIELLNNDNVNVLILKDHIPVDSRDSIVISKAQELNSILLTLNGDFADIITYPPDRYKGIIALQLRNHPEIIPQLVDRLNRYLNDNPEMDHYSGKLFIVDVSRIRVKKV